MSSMSSGEAAVSQKWQRKGKPKGKGEGTGRAAGYDMAGVGLLLLAAAAGWSDMVLLVFGHVVSGWVLCVVLVCAAVVAAGLRALWLRSEAGRTVEHSRSALMSGLRVVAATAAVLSCAAGALDELGAEYYVLHPTGPDGCTAVVRETSFLVLGSGDVYAIGASHIGWRPSGSWIADDGHRPIAAGTYELGWHEDGGGSLTVHGTPGDPIVSGGLATLDCGS
ncbi:hypothetical protein [Streptomyces sp. 3211.6]|uniref:hypothetical protein n=1 Tax=Streptomyces sp. 3211.6 TaxID=1938845 RepID=UPI0011E5DEB5|nr:hypothetical protein [Streptomyces sp. 3211.6]